MAGALYIMNQNGMLDAGLMGIVFLAFAVVVIIGGVVTLVDWIKARFSK